MVTINIGRKEAVFFVAILLIFVLAGIGIAIANDPTIFGHSDNGPIHIVGDNVGIGTESPGSPIEVTPSGNAAIGVGTDSGIGYSSGALIAYAKSNRYFAVSSGSPTGGQLLKVEMATGNVGIGVGGSAIVEKLDVRGNIKASGTICDSSGCIGGGSEPATGSVVGGGSQGSGYSCTGSVWGSAFCSGANVACPSGSTRRRSGKYFNDIGDPKADFYFCIQN